MPKPTHNDDLFRLPPEERLVKLRQLLREAVAYTQMFDRLWNQKNDQLNDWLDRMGKHDVLQRATIKNENLTLQDYFGAGQWWRDKAVYLSSLIQTELMMLEGRS